MGADFWIVVRFWGVLFLMGAAAYPLTRRLFPRFFDSGYLFSKALGMAVVSYGVYVVGTLRIVPFTTLSIVMSLVGLFLVGCLLTDKKDASWKEPKTWIRIGIAEAFFFGALLLWSWVKAHEPSIRGLEKFMDYGFMKSILESTYFPPGDMWWAGKPINYYYFGHLVVAVLTKLSGLDLAYTFNLMLAAIFAFTLTMSFGIGYQLSNLRAKFQEPNSKRHFSFSLFNLPIVWTLNFGIWNLFSGILTSLLVTLAGNMQTLYAFTKGYTGENVVPFWTVLWSISEFWEKLPEGLNRYWYANATRFIPLTIHEFPSYSFVVSDVHGHVLSLPFVLLAIALLIEMFSGNDHGENSKILEPRSKQISNNKRLTFRILNVEFVWNLEFVIWKLLPMVVYGFLVGVLLMTNAIDGPIYAALFCLVSAANSKFQMPNVKWWKQYILSVVIVGATAFVTSMPFLTHFSSFVKGVGINCPPAQLANSKIGPFLFEGVEKCQHSPLWMLWLLWGFFVYCVVFLILQVISEVKIRQAKRVLDYRIEMKTNSTQIERLLLMISGFSLLLLVVPEFIYFKDIYPAHFRSNTMFKLGYQAFIMLSIVSGYTIMRWVSELKSRVRSQRSKVFGIVFIVLLIPQIFLISIYPYFSVRSYFNNLSNYQGIYGLTWLQTEYPDDFGALTWLNEQARAANKKGLSLPVIVEADGDSYTDYERMSAFSGMPTVVGWAVHEWLWRGTYDTVAPRREHVRTIYESSDIGQTRYLLDTYNVRYIIVGAMEKKKFTAINFQKIATLARVVYTRGDTTIYEVMR